MDRSVCACAMEERLLAGRRLTSGLCIPRDEIVRTSSVRYVFTGATATEALREVACLAHLPLRTSGVYVRTDKTVVALHLRSLKGSVAHLACAGFVPLHTGLYVHLRHLAYVELEPANKRVAVQIVGQELEWLRLSRRQVRRLRALLGIPGRPAPLQKTTNATLTATSCANPGQRE